MKAIVMCEYSILISPMECHLQVMQSNYFCRERKEQDRAARNAKKPNQSHGKN